MSAEDENDVVRSPEEEDFARLLEQSDEPRAFHAGETVAGTIVALGKDVAFIDVGGKGEATIDLVELADEDGNVAATVGDPLQAVVVSTAGGVKLSYKLARGAASRQALDDAFQAGLPVEGRVESAIKGGFTVSVGGERGFCPISQIDTAYTSDPEVHEGQVYTFRITELDGERGRNLVLSRRALLEEEERERADEIRGTIVPGVDLPGRVVSVQSYGAFVDLGGGIQGLLHVSEMGWSRVSTPAEVVQPGDEVTVRVLRVDEDGEKISLGIKQLQPDPWSTVADTYMAGQVQIGPVTRLADFGAFIELAPGIDALAHVSTFPPTGRREGWKDAVKVGDVVGVEILTVDAERRRIGVAVVDPEAAAGERAIRPDLVSGARVTGKIERHESYGVFVFLAPGRTGLLPVEETGLERGSDLRKAFPAGSDLEVMVLEVDGENGRIRLSRRAVFDAEERGDANAYHERQEKTQGDSFGALGDKLRAALESRKP